VGVSLSSHWCNNYHFKVEILKECFLLHIQSLDIRYQNLKYF
jgi:hypothetical protein